MKRSSILYGGLFALAAALLLAGCDPNRERAQHTDAAGAAEPTQITISYVDWAEAVAVSELMKALLETYFDYDVRLQQAEIETAFKQVASGETDAFLDVWLPHTHANYWQQHHDNLVDLGPWYRDGATLGIAVPDYVEARSIGDLKEAVDRFKGEIVGIEAGAGLTRIVEEEAMSAYALDNYTLSKSSTASMIAALDKAVNTHKSIAVTAWKPHWIFNAYPLRYLDDPKNAMGDAETIHAVVRQGLENDAPVAYRLLDAFRLDARELGSLELAIEDARSPYGGVQNWLDDHADLVQPWITAAREKVDRELY